VQLGATLGAGVGAHERQAQGGERVAAFPADQVVWHRASMPALRVARDCEGGSTWGA